MSAGRAILLSVVVAMAALAATEKYVIVYVRQSSDDGVHLWIPVPLSLARTALQFVPPDAARIDNPEMAVYLPLARSLARELEDVRDAALIEVNNGDNKVSIVKSGEHLIVDVLTQDEKVHISVPVRVLREVLESWGGETLRVETALSSLRGVSGEVVHVLSRDAEVKIAVW